MIFNFTIEGFLLFLQNHSSEAYIILFLGSYFETLIGTGFFLYGEMVFIPGALLAGAGALNIWLVIIATIGGGVLGDNSSYFLGRRYGKSFFSEHRRIFNHTNYRKGQEYFNKFGPKGIFMARLMGPLSWITPFLAGSYKVPYRKFFLYNLPGAILGIGQFLIIGYFFGNNYRKILDLTGRYFVYFFLIIAIFAIIYYAIRKKSKV